MNETSQMTGCLKYNDPPERNTVYKYFVPEDIYPGDAYANYYSGATYVMTIFAALKLASVKDSVRILPMDDTYIGGRDLN